MTAREIERFQKVAALFDGALEYPPGPLRDAFLERETDLDLRAEVRELLAGDQRLTTSVPPETLPAFGTWQAVKLLGRGGMGVVYLAERADGAFHKVAAVKAVPIALASAEIEERFRKERQFLASLDHPKIARLIDGGLTSAGLPYLVMEFAEGLPIDRYCETRQLDARARIALMRQVLEALIYIHGRHVIHRDLKASNILVDAGGSAKLLDFGTAGLVNAGGDKMFAFTPQSASPEQVQGKPVTFASDIYSAGVLLYRLLTGRPPYELPDTPHAIADTIAHAEPQPSGLDPPLDAILRQALRKNAEERYSSAEAMNADLARYLEGRRVEARLPRNSVWIVVGTALLAICVVAGWLTWHRHTPISPPSIAVLPFTGTSYLTSGIGDEIAADLSRRKTLRVISQASARQVVADLKGKPLDVRSAGQRLHATCLLTGRLQTNGASNGESTGDIMNVVATLTNTSDGAVIWTNTYRRSTAYLSVIETDLETGILTSLGIAESPGLKKHVPNEQAHEFFLKARFEWNQPTPASNALAREDYQHALQLDPDYADAWAGLAAAIWNRNPNPQGLEGFKLAADYYQKAIRLDPDNGSAHAGAAAYAMYFDWDWKRAEREFQLASGDGRIAGGEIGLAFLYQVMGRRKEANQHAMRAWELDPVSTVGILNQAQFLNREGRFAESYYQWLRLAEQFPTVANYQSLVAVAEARLGKSDQALQRLRGISQPAPIVITDLATVEALAGHRDEALRLIRPLEQGNRDGHIPFSWIAGVYAAIGDKETTVKYLDRAIDRHEPTVIYLPVHPDYAKWRDTPEFHRLKKRMRLDW